MARQPTNDQESVVGRPRAMMSSNGGMWICLLLALLLVPAATFQSCPSICVCKWKNGKRWVECRDQAQISIPDKIDIETQVLDLSDNNLQILPREVFARYGMTNLQRLHLANCKIGQIDPTAFRGLTNLVELNLAGNLLTAVPTATFSDIPFLRELRLNHNPLQRVESDAFEMIPELVFLDLSYCEIKKVAAKAFVQLTKLEKLFLNANKIRELKPKTVETFAPVHGIELNNNPWHCDCKLRPLKEWLVTANVPLTFDPQCDSPNRIQGKAFAALDLDQFACSPEVLSAPRFVEANMGENATIHCKVESVPKSNVRWYREGNEILNNSMASRGMQKFIIMENGSFQVESTLVMTNVRVEDSGQYQCVMNNPAGKAEANFTLQVGYFVGGVASLESGHIAGIALTLTFVAVLIIVLVLVFVLRHGTCRLHVLARQCCRRSHKSSGTPMHTVTTTIDAPANSNGHYNMQNGNGSSQTNPVEKPPRLTNIQPTFNGVNSSNTSVTTGHLSSNGSLTINGTVFNPKGKEGSNGDHSYPQSSTNSNPDLIPSGGDSSANRGVSHNLITSSPSVATRHTPLRPSSPAQRHQLIRPTPMHAVPNVIPNMCAQYQQLGSDVLYPSDRTYSPYLSHRKAKMNYSPMSPMRSDKYSRTLGPNVTSGHASPAAMNTSSTLPRPMPVNMQCLDNQFVGPGSSTAKYPSGDFQAINPLREYGFPSDYGLPVVIPEDGVTMNPLSELLCSEESDIVGGPPMGHTSPLDGRQLQNHLHHQHHLNQSQFSSSSSSTLSPMRSVMPLSSSGIGDLSTNPPLGASNVMMGYDSPTMMNSSSGDTPTSTSTGGSSGVGLMAHRSSWLKSAAAMPPSSSRSGIAKARHFKTGSRDSPDEGIQDDCSTDV